MGITCKLEKMTFSIREKCSILRAAFGHNLERIIDAIHSKKGHRVNFMLFKMNLPVKMMQ